jgi:hypothetical protein
MNDTPNSNFGLIDGDTVGLFGLPNETGSPERRLLLAILERAILDFVGNDEKEREIAQIWLFEDYSNNSDVEVPITVSEICEALDLDCTKVRNRVRKMPRRGDKKVAPWYFERHIKAA